MSLNVTRRCMLAVLAASTAFLLPVLGNAEEEVQALVVKQEHLVDQADNLARELFPTLDGSSKDIRRWMDGDGYKLLVRFTDETMRLARSMLDNEKSMKAGKELNRLGVNLKDNVSALPKGDGEKQTLYALKEIYDLLRQFEKF